MKLFQGIVGANGAVRGYAVALGNFDGVHRGHQELFRQAKQLGPAAALTFEPHPGKVLQPDLAPKLITQLPRKLELLEECGLDAAIVQPFTLDYARTTAAQFEGSLLDELGAKNVVVGVDFTYGAERRGTVETLQKAAAQRGAAVQVVSPVTVDGVVVSSTKIREYILEGRVRAAQRLLGRYFDLDGVVVPGQGRGRGIGFPTANVDTPNELRPAPGVYAVRARIRAAGGQADSAWVGGAANIGVKPTFGGTQVTVEVHLLDFSGDLYGKAVRVQFLDRLRSEQRFGSVAELAEQIGRDVRAAREVIAGVVD
jgi:riboflavin kinase/FMN adenylyltransferase